jgi:acetate kinase
MSTRAGDLDPGAMLYLQETLQQSPAAVRAEVEERGGLLGVSATSSDMRDLLARAGQDPRAEEAVALFCYNAKKHLGALASALGGITSLVFTGGIGEHAAEVRGRICDGLEFLGLHLDLAANAANTSTVSLPESPVTIRVLPTNEELMIARHTARTLLGVRERT